MSDLHFLLESSIGIEYQQEAMNEAVRIKLFDKPDKLSQDDVMNKHEVTRYAAVHWMLLSFIRMDFIKN